MNESALERLRWEAKEKEVERKVEAFRREHIEKKKKKQVQITGMIYVKLLASCVTITEEIIMFEQEQRSKELEEELEATLNFLKKTITSTTNQYHKLLLFHIQRKKWRLNLNLLSRNSHNQFLNQDLWRRKSCSNLWALEKYFS